MGYMVFIERTVYTLFPEFPDETVQTVFFRFIHNGAHDHPRNIPSAFLTGSPAAPRPETWKGLTRRGGIANADEQVTGEGVALHGLWNGMGVYCVARPVGGIDRME